MYMILLFDCDILYFYIIQVISVLDVESEYLVQEVVDRVMKGRTVIVIVYRLFIVRNVIKVSYIINFDFV